MFFFFSEKDRVINFAKEIFENASYKVIDKENGDYDFLVNKEKNTYAVMVKNKITNNLISKLDNFKKAKNEYIPLIFVFDDIEKESKQLLTSKYNVQVIDIANIIYIIQNNEKLMKKLKEIVNYSIAGIPKVEPKMKIKMTEEKIKEKEFKEYVEELKTIRPGLDDCYKYQKYCANLVKEMFNDDLDSWAEQERTEDSSFRFDMVARIKYRKKEEYNDFFNMIENSLQSKYIIFEFKNYSEKITKDEISSTASYLYEKALRKMEIIITRKGADESAKKEISRRIRNEGKTIIVINDIDLICMLDLWKENDDINPSVILQNKLNDLYIHLE